MGYMERPGAALHLAVRCKARQRLRLCWSQGRLPAHLTLLNPGSGSTQAGTSTSCKPQLGASHPPPAGPNQVYPPPRPTHLPPLARSGPARHILLVHNEAVPAALRVLRLSGPLACLSAWGEAAQAATETGSVSATVQQHWQPPAACWLAGFVDCWCGSSWQGLHHTSHSPALPHQACGSFGPAKLA
jgi:hypothetical protein